MAIIFIPDETLEQLRKGELTFKDLEHYLLDFPEVKEQGTLIYKKQPIQDLIRWEVFERDDFTCNECGSRRFLQADHIIPESKGGETTLENLQTLCKRCNVKKGNKWQKEE